MSIQQQSVVQVFESGIRTPPTSTLDDLIRAKLQAALQEVPATPMTERRDTGTLVADMGEYLTQAARIWSRLTENLVKGELMEPAALAAHEQSRVNSRFSDLSTVVAMDVEFSRLCKIKDLTEKFSRDVQAIWRPEPLMPESPNQQAQCSPFRSGPGSNLVPSPDMDVKSRDGHKGGHMQQVKLEHVPFKGNGSGSDESDDDDEQFSQIDYEALKQRGKGSYCCPKGASCDKGGVDKQGNLVIFDRNSSFAQHCNKHRKPWRCEVPGCPNPPRKRRFARRDGLERHKATVKHCLVT